MSKEYKLYRVYVQDTDGSERLGGTFHAKSLGHAKAQAEADGLKKIGDVVLQPQ